MTMSPSDHAQRDLLGSEAPGTGSHRPSRLALLTTAAGLVLAGALIVQTTREDVPGAVAVEDMSGAMTLSDFRSTTMESPLDGDQERDAHGSGPVRLELSDRELEGRAFVDFSGSFQGDERRGAAHLWGDISLVVGSNECRGSFGWSNYYTTPAESGGSMHARCEDGATLAASLVLRQDGVGPAEAAPIDPQRLALHLRDGWYVAGPEKDD